MKLGIFSLPKNDMTFKQAVDYAKEKGLYSIEPFPAAEFKTPDVEAAKRLKEYADEKGIKICCFSMGVTIVGDGKREQIENLKKYAKVTAALGSPYLHHTILLSINHSYKAVPFKELLAEGVESIREVYDYAEQVGVKTVYEDQGYFFNGCERFEALLNEVNRDIGVNADLGNIYFVGEKAEDFVGRFAAFIKHVHIKDYLFKSGDKLFPGEEWYKTRSGDYLRGTIAGHGIVDFGKVFKILNSVNYNGCYCVEYDGIEDKELAMGLSLKNARRYYEMSGEKSGTKEVAYIKGE